MYHDYTLIRLAKEHVRELLGEKRAYEVAKSLRPPEKRASTSDRANTSTGNCPDVAGANR